MEMRKGFYFTTDGEMAEVIGKSISKKLGFPWVGLVDFEHSTLWNESGEACVDPPPYPFNRNLSGFLGEDFDEASAAFRKGLQIQVGE